MRDVRPKDAVYASLAGMAQAIAHPHRLALLEHLAQGPRTVEALADITGLSFANTSRHLQVLRRAQLVDAQRSGKHAVYDLLGHGSVVSLLKALGGLGERNRADMREVMSDYFFARDALSPVSREELLGQLDQGVVILDVRPEDEYQLGHIPGALNIPYEQLHKKLRLLDKTRDIVAYCRGPYCVLSFEAVAALRHKGFRIRRLEDGFPEWKAAGLAVES